MNIEIRKVIFILFTLINLSSISGAVNHTAVEMLNDTEALNSYNEAIRIDPNDTKSLIGKGNALSLLGRYNEAVAEFDKAIEINPNDSLAWYGRGYALYLMKSYSDAKESNQRAVKLTLNTKKIDVNASLEVDPDFKYEQIGVVGRAYPLLIELKAKDDVDLSNNIYIDFLKNGKPMALDGSAETKDVLVNDMNYWGPFVYNLELGLNRRILPKGQNDSFSVNVTFLSPGNYGIIIAGSEKVFPVQIVDQLTMRDLKTGMTSLQVARESKEIAERSQSISIITPLVAFVAIVTGSLISFYLSKRHDRHRARTRFLNLVTMKLDRLVTMRETWMMIYRDYRAVKDNFVSIYYELSNMIPLLPDDFSEDIISDLLNLIKSLYDLSSYNFITGNDAFFEEKTQTIVDESIRIKQKILFLL